MSNIIEKVMKGLCEIIIAFMAAISAREVARMKGQSEISAALIESGDYDVNIYNETGKFVPKGTATKSDGTIVYIFSNTEKRTKEIDGLDYVEYKLTVNPIVSQYKVMVYPYLFYRKDQTREYVLIEKLYTQDQYLANEEGTCLLKREDITVQLEDAFREELQCEKDSVGTGCLIAIEYYEDNQLQKEIFELSSGQLHDAKLALTREVIGNSQNNTIKKMDVRGWPCNMEVIQEIVNDSK